MELRALILQAADGELFLGFRSVVQKPYSMWYNSALHILQGCMRGKGSFGKMFAECVDGQQVRQIVSNAQRGTQLLQRWYSRSGHADLS